MDLTKCESQIRQYLTSIAASAIRDECRRCRPTPSDSAEVLLSIYAPDHAPIRSLSLCDSLPNDLREMLAHIRQTGGAKGAQAAHAKRHGRSRNYACKKFKKTFAAYKRRVAREG